jgi:putative aldouronate transport system substrate-binding protein
MRWADYLYDEERSIYFRYGRSVEALGDGKFEWVGIPEGEDAATWIWAPETAIPHLVTFENWVERAGIQEKDRERIAISELLEDQLTEMPAFLDIVFSTEEQEELGMYQEDIRSYVDQKIAKWITQGGVEEEWDTYLSELASIGLDKWLAVLQKGYDRFRQ